MYVYIYAYIHIYRSVYMYTDIERCIKIKRKCDRC